MTETYYSLTELVKLTDNLIAAMPTTFYNGIMAVRSGLASLPAADVVARDCYDRLLAENDELRKERPVVRCRDCKYRHDDDFCGGRGWPAQLVPDDGYCDSGARMDGDGAEPPKEET